MKKSILGAMTAAMLVMPVAMTSTAASAQQWHGDQQGWDPSRDYRDNGHNGDRGRDGGDRRLGRHDQVYRGHDGRYYCRRSDGTTGTVIGAIGGGAGRQLCSAAARSARCSVRAAVRCSVARSIAAM